MTFPTPRRGTVVPRPPRTRTAPVAARPRGTVARAVAALALMVALVTGAVAPASAQSTPDPTPTAAPGAVTAAVAPLGDGILRTGQTLAFTVRVANTTTSPVPAGQAEVALGRTPLADPDAVTRWLDDSTTAAGLETIATSTLAATAAQTATTATVGVDVAGTGIRDLAPGVYPVAATVTAGVTRTARTVVVIPDDGAARPTALLVPITAAPTGQGLLTAADLTTLTAEDGALTAQLEAVSGTTAILAIDPSIPAAIRTLGSTAPASATAWLDALLALPNDRFALQFGDADPTTQIDAGLTELLQPTSLAGYLTLDGFAPPTATDATTPAPIPTAAPEPELPDVADLTDIGPARDDVFWPGEPVTPAVVAALTAQPDAGAAGALTIVPSTAVDADDSARARTPEGDLLVYDAAASAALATAASHPDDATARSAALAEAMALTSFAVAADTGPLLLTVGRDDDRTATALRTVINAVTAAPRTTPIGITALTNADPAAVTVADAAPDEYAAARVTALQRQLSDAEDVAAFATVLDDPALLTGPVRAQTLHLLAVGWRDAPDAWATAVAAHDARIDATLDSVEVLSAPDVNLLGTNAPLSFSVRNDLAWPVEVVLIAQTSDPQLIVRTRTEVTAGAQQNTRVEVPVEARIGNGEVDLELSLFSRSGVEIGAPQSVTVAVRAEWESVGLITVGVVVGALIVIGVFRTVRRVRRRGAAPASAPAEPSDRNEPSSRGDAG